jgi:cytochrome c oxidase subunit 2
MYLNKSMTRFLTNILVIFSLLFMLSPNILNAAWGLNMTQGVTPISQDVYNMHMTSLYVVTVIGILVFSVYNC